MNIRTKCRGYPSNNVLCYSLLRHHVLRDSSQVVVRTDRRDGLRNRMRVQNHAVVPHHHTVRGCTHDDDLQLQSETKTNILSLFFS